MAPKKIIEGIGKILFKSAVRRQPQARGKNFIPEGNELKGTTKRRSSEPEGAALDPETGGSVDVSRQVEQRMRSGAEKVTRGKASGDRGIVAESTSRGTTERAKTKVQLEALVRDEKATAAQRRRLKEMEDKDVADTLRAEKTAAATRRENAAREAGKDKRDPRDTLMQTGEIMEGYNPTDREMKQAISNLNARKTDPKIRERMAVLESMIGGKTRTSSTPKGMNVRAEERKKGGKVAKRADGGKVVPIPKRKPMPPVKKVSSEDAETIKRGNRMQSYEAGAARAMGVKGYKSGGPVGCGVAMRGYGKGPYKKK